MRRVVLLVLAVLVAATGLVAVAGEVAPRHAYAWENGLGRTPPMGWNQWNAFGCTINEQLVRQTADALVSTGLRDAGYVYVNIDDCWMARTRDGNGNLVADPAKFPSGMRALADYVHARGLKLGIYSSAGTATCQGFPASLNFEAQDARLFASWTIDYLKYDNCNNQGVPALTRYTRMRDAIIAAGRPMVYSITEWGTNQPWNWGHAVGNLWRTTGDITDRWSSVLSIYRINVGLAPYARPGAFNDPDMLEVGNGGMTATEYRSHFSLWAMMAAPLLIGTDLRNASAATLAILGNRDIIAVDQDRLGIQARLVRSTGGQHVLVRPLANGDFAVALFNENAGGVTISTTAAELGLPSASSYRLRDLWTGATRDVTGTTGAIAASVPGHGTVVYRVTPSGGPAAPPAGTSFVSDRPWLWAANGWGPAERDRSNGEAAAGDGRGLVIGGTGYAKGIGAHAFSTVAVYLGGRCSTFTTDVGVDAEVGTQGSVTFTVLADGATLATTGVLRGGQPAQRLTANVTGRTMLHLVVGNGGDNINYDHADWANPTVICS